MKDRIDSLQHTISEMTTEELLAFLRKVRMERKTPQHQLKARAKKKTQAKIEVDEMLKKLSPEQIRELLKGDTNG